MWGLQPPPPLRGPSNDKEHLDTVASLVRRAAERHAFCWQVLGFFAVYIIFAASVLSHADVRSAYGAATSAAACANVDGTVLDPSFPSADVTEIYPWVAGTVAPAVIPGWQVGDGTDSSIRRRGGACGADIVLGGLRLSQWRRAGTACPLSSELGPAIRAVCYAPPADGSNDGEAAGEEDATSFPPYAISTASSWNVSFSFTRLPWLQELAQADLLPLRTARAFHAVLLAVAATSEGGDGSATNSMATLQGLAGAEWLDDSTGTVEVGVAVVSAESARVTGVTTTFTASGGGRLAGAVRTQTLPLDPYITAPGTAVLDAIVLVYALGAALSVLAGVAGRLLLLTTSARGKTTATTATTAATIRSLRRRVVPWRPRVCSLHGLWQLFVSYGTTLALFAAVGSWWFFLGSLTPVRAAIATGAWSTSEGARDTLVLHALLDKAGFAYERTTASAVAALAFLTAQGASYLQLQPSLALVAATLSRALSDMVHLGCVIALIMFGYGVAGHIVFGPYASEWSTVSGASFTLVRMFAAWDYDLAPMEVANPYFAAAYIGSFMFVVANALLWIWFTVVIDAYTTLRNNLKEGPPLPSLADDMWSGLALAGKGARAIRSKEAIAELIRERRMVSEGHVIMASAVEALRTALAASILSKQELQEGKGEEGTKEEEDSSVSTSIATTHLAESLAPLLSVDINTALSLLQAYERCDDDSGTLQALLVRVGQARGGGAGGGEGTGRSGGVLAAARSADHGRRNEGTVVDGVGGEAVFANGVSPS